MHLLPHSPPDYLRHSLAYGQDVRSSRGKASDMGMAYTNTIAVASLAATCREMAGVKTDTHSWPLSVWHGLACCGVRVAVACDIQVGRVQEASLKIEIKTDKNGACGASNVRVFGGLLSLAQYAANLCGMYLPVVECEWQ